jgi:hypothetical protein
MGDRLCFVLGALYFVAAEIRERQSTRNKGLSAKKIFSRKDAKAQRNPLETR